MNTNWNCLDKRADQKKEETREKLYRHSTETTNETIKSDKIVFTKIMIASWL